MALSPLRATTATYGIGKNSVEATSNFPPPPPGYDPLTWTVGQWDNGNYVLTDPEGNRWTIHPEDKGHWRHWDIRDKNNNNKGSWLRNSKKRQGNQKKKSKPNQSECDPSGDVDSWCFFEHMHVNKCRSYFLPAFTWDLAPSNFQFSCGFTFRIPILRVLVMGM